MAHLAGGISGDKELDDEVKQIAVEFRKKVEEAYGKAFGIYEPLSYRSQVVAGRNLFIHVKVDDDAIITVKVYDRFGSKSLSDWWFGIEKPN